MTKSYEIYAKIRDEKRLKDYTVAKMTGISQSSFSDWKSGRSEPKADKLQKIATSLGVPMEYLMTGVMPGELDAEDMVKNDQEKKLLLSFRGAGNLSDEEFEDLRKMFENTMDIYLSATRKKKK